MFTKQHYEAIALAMQSAATPLERTETTDAYAQWGRDVDELAKVFKADNAAFDWARFRVACQPGANVKAKNYRAGDGVVKAVKG